MTAVTAAAGAQPSAGIVVGCSRFGMPCRTAAAATATAAPSLTAAPTAWALPGKGDSFALEARARAPKGGLYSDGDEITLEFDRRRRELRVSDGRDGKPISQRLKKDSVLAKTLDHDGESRPELVPPHAPPAAPPRSPPPATIPSSGEFSFFVDLQHKGQGVHVVQMHSLLTRSGGRGDGDDDDDHEDWGDGDEEEPCHSVPMPCPFDDARWAQLRAAAATAGGEEAETERALQEATTKAEAEHDGFAQRRHSRPLGGGCSVMVPFSELATHARVCRARADTLALTAVTLAGVPKAATAPDVELRPELWREREAMAVALRWRVAVALVDRGGWPAEDECKGSTGHRALPLLPHPAVAARRAAELKRQVLEATAKVGRVMEENDVFFNGAREERTQQSALGVAQSWSIKHLDNAKYADNARTLDLIAKVLKQYPELFCEVKGTTSGAGKTEADPNLARHFGLDATRDYARIMDKLAEERALACRSALLSLGVAESQLLPVTFQGCTGEQKVDFIPRAEAPKGWAKGGRRIVKGDGDDEDDYVEPPPTVDFGEDRLALLLPPATSRPPRVRVDVFMAEAGKKEALYGSTVVALDSALWAEDRMDLGKETIKVKMRSAKASCRRAGPPTRRRRRRRRRSSAPSAAAPTRKR